MKRIRVQQQAPEPTAAKAGSIWVWCNKRSLRRYYPDQVLAPAAPGAKGIISARYYEAPLVRWGKDTAYFLNVLMGEEKLKPAARQGVEDQQNTKETRKVSA
jgi:hypothetical protein